MVRKALIGAVMLVVAFAAPAAAQYNPIVVAPGSVEAGQAITVTGDSCVPNTTITITVTPVSSTKAAGDPIVTKEVTTDADGHFSTTITIPAGTPAGTYMVTSDAACVKGTTVEVVDPGGSGGTGGTGGTGGGSLPRTGSDLDRLGLAGAGLLVIGGLVLVATKRRRHDAPAAI